MAHLRIQRTRSEIHRVYLWKAKDIFKLYCIRWTLYISFHSTFLPEQSTLNVNKPLLFFRSFQCQRARTYDLPHYINSTCIVYLSFNSLRSSSSMRSSGLSLILVTTFLNLSHLSSSAMFLKYNMILSKILHFYHAM